MQEKKCHWLLSHYFKKTTRTGAHSISVNVKQRLLIIMNGCILLPQNKCPQLVWTGKVDVCRQTGHSQSWPGEAHDCVGSSRGKRGNRQNKKLFLHWNGLFYKINKKGTVEFSNDGCLLKANFVFILDWLAAFLLTQMKAAIIIITVTKACSGINIRRQPPLISFKINDSFIIEATNNKASSFTVSACWLVHSYLVAVCADQCWLIGWTH